MKIIDHWFKMSLLLKGKIMVMIIKMMQLMAHQSQNQMNHAHKEIENIYHPTIKRQLSP